MFKYRIFEYAIAIPVAMAACHAPEAASPAPAPQATASEARAADAGAVTKAQFCALLDRVSDAILADIRATAARADLTPEESRAAILRASPEGATPVIREQATAVGLSSEALQAFVGNHQDEAQECLHRLAVRFSPNDPALTRVFQIAKLGNGASSPLAWREGPEAALREAVKVGRPALLRFHAAWNGSDRELDRTTFADPGLVADLERFVLVHVDATDDDAAKGAKAKYNIVGLPTLIVFDARGREVRRFTQYVAPQALRSALADVNGR